MLEKGDGRVAIVTHDGALGRGVAPGLIVTREDPEVATPHELRVVYVEEWRGGREELRVVDHLRRGYKEVGGNKGHSYVRGSGGTSCVRVIGGVV